MAPREFTITAEHALSSDNPTLTSLHTLSNSNNGNPNTGIITETVTNRTGTALPETGAKGTAMLIGGSAMLVLVAVVFMVTRKRMSVYED